MQRVYLDNAATSWPKPEAVYAAVDEFQRGCGAAAGRGGYRSADRASAIVQSARRRVAELVGLADPRGVLFTQNGTDSLNLAIHGLLRPGDHVVTTDAEHNSVLRPLHAAQAALGCEVEYVGCDGDGAVAASAVLAAVRPTTRLVAVTHASNVTGALQPVEAIGAGLTGSGALLLVDAAQTIGHVPVDMQSLRADLIAAPAHKGLLAPLGLGLLCCNPRALGALQPVRQGGTGGESHLVTVPAAPPERFEPGNLNLPAIAGLDAALCWIEQQHFGQTHPAVTATRTLLQGLKRLPGVCLLGPPAHQARAPVVSLLIEGYAPTEAAAILDGQFGVECRAGLHCAARIHPSLGTSPHGTLRLSPGVFTSPAEIETVTRAIAAIAGASGDSHG